MLGRVTIRPSVFARLNNNQTITSPGVGRVQFDIVVQTGSLAMATYDTSVNIGRVTLQPGTWYLRTKLNPTSGAGDAGNVSYGVYDLTADQLVGNVVLGGGRNHDNSVSNVHVASYFVTLLAPRSFEVRLTAVSPAANVSLASTDCYFSMYLVR